MRDFHLASKAREQYRCHRVMLIRHIKSFTHSLQWIERVSERTVSTIHVYLPSVKHKLSFLSSIAPSTMLFRQFFRLRPTVSRGWSWHSVPVSKRREAFSFKWLPYQQRPDKMVSFHDYEIPLLFLLLAKFHGSGKWKFFLPYKGFYSVFLPCAILSLDTASADP